MFADSTRSGIITPLGSLVDPLVYCRITRRSGSWSGRSQRSLDGTFGAPGQHGTHRLDRRIAGDGFVERGELVVDQHQLGVAVADPGTRRVDELVERAHPHREREHHRRDAGQPATAHDRHQLPAGRARAPRRGRRAAAPWPAAPQRRSAPRRGSDATTRGPDRRGRRSGRRTGHRYRSRRRVRGGRSSTSTGRSSSCSRRYFETAAPTQRSSARRSDRRCRTSGPAATGSRRGDRAGDRRAAGGCGSSSQTRHRNSRWMPWIDICVPRDFSTSTFGIASISNPPHFGHDGPGIAGERDVARLAVELDQVVVPAGAPQVVVDPALRAHDLHARSVAIGEFSRFARRGRPRPTSRSAHTGSSVRPMPDARRTRTVVVRTRP